MAKLSTISNKEAYTMLCHSCEKAFLNGQKNCPHCGRPLTLEKTPQGKYDDYEIER
jgi:rRNA maturation endonuclease Nob1